MTSQSRASLPQSQKNRELGEIRAFDFFNFENTCDLTDGPASINNRKWTPDLFTLYTTFYDVSVLSYLFSKTEMSQFGESGNQYV